MKEGIYASAISSMAEEPKALIGQFKATDDLMLRRAPNGGWIVATQCGNPAFQNEVIGAYGGVEEMLDALKSALT